MQCNGNDCTRSLDVDSLQRIPTNCTAWTCTNMLWYTGCGAQEPPEEPQEGDLRLVPSVRVPGGTATCDEYHTGAVQMFRNGNWTGFCQAVRTEDEDSFTVDAQVICRQLGFPFGTVTTLSVAGIAPEDRADSIAFTSVLPPLIFIYVSSCMHASHVCKACERVCVTAVFINVSRRCPGHLYTVSGLDSTMTVLYSSSMPCAFRILIHQHCYSPCLGQKRCCSWFLRSPMCKWLPIVSVLDSGCILS